MSRSVPFRTSASPRHRRVRRAGISLMEVMFAIGIIMVGLLGVAVLIPVAGKLANDGTTKDRAARTGLNAVREMELRGMTRFLNWVHLGYPSEAIRLGGPYQPSNGFCPGYCLDPRFVAANMTPLMANAGGALQSPADARFFPYVHLNTSGPANDPSDLRMRRLSFYRGWGANGIDDDGDGAIDELDELALGVALAEELFVAQDDLRISLPGIDDNQQPTLPAEQVYGQTSDKRQSDGRISWMATIVPRNDGKALSQDTFILSVVVFNNRDLAMPMDGLTERVATIPFTVVGGNNITVNGFHGGGVSGGDVSIMVRPTRTLSNGVDPTVELQVKRGEWVVLCRKSPMGNIFRWYKVTEVDPGIADSVELSGSSPPSGVPIRHLSLFGPDWTPDAANPTLVYIVPGVITVYEKTIRLENTSLWTQ